MITKFGTLYAGHVDLDDIGLAGIPVNDRWLPDDQLATVFEKAESIAVLMDRSGYDTFWLAEHHFQREGYECIPNLLLFGVHLCHLTERIKIGCGFNIAPMWNPLRLAEDYATADILTGGRVIFGVGRGYHTREVESFGAPMLDQAANRDLFEEQVDIIFKAFNNRSFSHRGPNYTIPPPVPYRGYELEEITLVPRPANLPVECYQPLVSASPRGIDFMIKHGIKGMLGGGAAPGGAADRVVAAWRDAHARNGRETELGQGPDHRVFGAPGRHRGQGHSRGGAIRRRGHEDVRPARVPQALRRASGRARGSFHRGGGRAAHGPRRGGGGVLAVRAARTGRREDP